MEKISLIVAAYNIERYIDRCMKSCMQQTDKNVEIIVVEDGSQDKTLDVLKQFQKEPRVTIISHERNKGLSEVRKTGYSAAQGKYILFVDGDDWLEEDAAECLRYEAEKSAADILCFQFFMEGAKNSMPYLVEPFETEDKEGYLARLFTGRIPPSIFTKFLRKSYVDENQIAFPHQMNCGEDVALAASLGMYAPRTKLFKKSLYHYRISPNSLSAAPSACMLEVLLATRFVEEQLKKLGLYAKYQKEFEYYAFLHNLYYRFDAMFTIPNPYREQLYQNWLSLHIHIAENPYFQQYFPEDTPKNQLMKNL